MAPTFVTRYLLAFQQYKWYGLAGALTVFGISSVIAIQPPPPPTFKAEAVMVPTGPPVAFTQTGSEIQVAGQDVSEYFLLSDAVLNAVSEKLIESGIQVDPVGLYQKTRVRLSRNETSGRLEAIGVTYDGEARQEAEAAIQLLLTAMVNQSRDANKARLRSVIDSINERLPSVEAELRAAEQDLEQYDRLEGPAIQAAQDGSLLSNITNSEQQRRQIDLTLAGIEAQIQSLQSKLGLTPDQAYASSALSADPIIANLRSQIYTTESQMAILSQDLRPEHPTMIELQQQLNAYDQLLQARAAEVISGGQGAALTGANSIRQDSSLDPARQALANELVGLETQRETLIQQQRTLQQTEQDLRQQYAALPNKQLERNRLAQVVAEKQAIYEQMVAKRIDAEAAEAETVASLRVSQPPQTQRVEPEVTSGIIVLIAGGFIGIIVGGAIIFLLDAVDGTIRTAGDLQSLLNEQDAPLLGLIPNLPQRPSQGLPILLSPQSAYHDDYERLRSNLRRATETAPQTLLVTSTIRQEGKTVTAFNLAIASARAGKRTLIIEADLRSQSQAMALGVEPTPDSQYEPLHYYGNPSQSIQLVPAIANLYIAPSPGPQRQTAAILESSEMQRFLQDVKGRFDMVVIDAPALSLSNDTLILEPYTDGVVLVTRPQVSQSAMLNEALEEMTESEDIRFLGAVISGSDSTAEVEPLLTDNGAGLSAPQPLNQASEVPGLSRV
ncbi:MAG: GumC family protein [Thainema sp.]